LGVQVVEEKYKWAGDLTQRTKTNYIVLHHVEATNCTPQDVHQWHLARGWAGIGYNYLVGKDGTVYRGRPQNIVGAHCQNYNSQSVGISAIGNYETEQMPAAQWEAIVALVNELKGVYPGVKVVGHKELNATACPGRNYPLEQIKAGIGPKRIIQEVLGMFKDVSNGHWAKESIERMAKLGIIKGDSEGNFKPDDPLTRAQLAAVLDRLLKLFGK